MSSQRLPGKMMMDIGGRVLIGRVIDRVRLSKKVSKIIVATSDHPSDDPIEQFCEVENIICYRGSLNNVAKRFMEIVLAENALSFVRINGDSPLIDPELIDCAISYFELGDNDLVTNVGVRTFPKGQSVEVILTNVFVSLYNELTTNEQREHVTKAFYERPENFRIMNFTSGGNFNSINMCIDTSEDKRNIEVVLKNVGREIGNWKDLSLLFSTLL